MQRSINEFPPHDSEDSLGPEYVADELRRLAAELPPGAESAPQRDPRVGATAPEAVWENNGPYAPQRSRRNRSRPVSPDPFMFHTTIWMEHDQEASARAHEEPIEQLRDRVCTMEANLETLRTRLTQVADLRDAQGLREGQRALITRLTEIEECTSVHTLREFTTKILRLESLVCGEQGGVIGEAVRACNRRLDNHKACFPSRHLQESPDPRGPKSQKSLKKFGGPLKSPKKDPKKSTNTQKGPKIGIFLTFSSILGLFCGPPKKTFF